MGLVQECCYKGALSVFTARVPSPVAVAVFLHGGGWVGGTPLQFEPQSAALALHHISSISIEYRVRARHKSTVYDSLADVLDCIPFLRTWCGSLPMIVIGASSGGLLAFHLAIDHRLPAAGAILLNPVVDLSADGFVSKATPPGGDISISPAHMPVQFLPPTLILQGSNDGVVRAATSRQFADRLQAQGFAVELQVFPGAIHGFFNMPPYVAGVAAQMAAFIVRCARDATAAAGSEHSTDRANAAV